MPTYAPLTNDPGGEDRVPLVGEEDYRATILEVTAGKKKDFTSGELKDVWTIKFNITSFADGAPAEDINGNQVESRWIWKDCNPNARGFTAAGEPSVLRQFLLAANGISDIAAELPGGDTDALIGREVVLTLRTAPGMKDGKYRNYVKGIKAISRRRTGKAVGQTDSAVQNGAVGHPATAPQPTAGRQAMDNGLTIDDAYLKAVASLVSDSDDPEPSEIAAVSRKLSK